MERKHLAVKEVMDAHAQFGLLDREKVKIGMGPNWPPHWDHLVDGEGIFHAGEYVVNDKSEHEMPDWPPQASAVGLPDGTLRYGSTGQLFEVKNGRWERATGGRPVPKHGSGP